MAENKKKNQAPASKHTKTQAKPKKKKQYTPFLKFICFLVIGASAYLLLEVFKEVYTTITLKKQLAEVQDKYQQVQDENSYLTTEKEKLEDPDYVASYARGTYLLTKDDEQVFYLPESSSN